MRKNKLFILGLVATFVAILSLTLVSSTWAKYTSTVTGSDSARVAKWVFQYGNQSDNLSQLNLSETQQLTINLFDTILDTDGNQESDVKASVDETIIAPGTKGTGTFVLKNTGEVNAKATITFTVTNTNNIPVKFTNAAGNELEATEGVYSVGEVNLQMDSTDGISLTLNWEWPFDNDTTSGANDSTDTALGIEGTATLTVTVTVVFTQID